MKNVLTRLFCLILVLMPGVLFAQDEETGLGGVAGNILQPVTIFSNFIGTICLIIGGSFMFASIVKYVEHRRAPLMVPISTVFFLLISGIVLVFLPFLYILTGYGVPFSLAK